MDKLRLVEVLGFSQPTDPGGDCVNAIVAVREDGGRTIAIELEPTLLLDLIPTIATIQPPRDPVLGASTDVRLTTFDIKEAHVRPQIGGSMAAVSMRLSEEGWLHFQMSRTVAQSLHAGLSKLLA